MVDWRTRFWIKAAGFGLAALAACLLGVAVIQRALVGRGVPANSNRPSGANPGSADVAAGTESRIRAFCGSCHAVPHADRFPRDAWHDKVVRGYQFYGESGRNDLDPPPIQQIVSYYRAQAPKQVEFPTPQAADHELQARFTVEQFVAPGDGELPPGVSHLRWSSLQQAGKPMLLACDMRQGTVAAVDLRDAKRTRRILAQLDNPCHIEPCDLDGDGARDLLVADLGSFQPAEHQRGRVVWLRPDPQQDTFVPVVAVSGLGRVADVRPADIDGDGDLDLVVAEFGLYQTGNVLLARNVAAAQQAPRFEVEQIDPRPGAIHVPIHDFDADGHPDFLALFSQEHECLELFRNPGGGRFLRYPVWAGPDLTFGSSGIELVDLDQDGDQDILYTNGDSFDNMYVNPQQGVQWLENLGQFRFAYHRLADLTGAYRALAGDIDLDGDLDIVVAAWLPRRPKPDNVVVERLASVICLEQTAPGVFARHTLEQGAPYHATMELADFDSDGDLDFAVGSHVASVEQAKHWLAVWWNQVVSRDRVP